MRSSVRFIDRDASRAEYSRIMLLEKDGVAAGKASLIIPDVYVVDPEVPMHSFKGFAIR